VYYTGLYCIVQYSTPGTVQYNTVQISAVKQYTVLYLVHIQVHNCDSFDGAPLQQGQSDHCNVVQDAKRGTEAAVGMVGP